MLLDIRRQSIKTEQTLLEGAKTASWRMSLSLAVFEQSALLFSVPSGTWSISEASVHAAASSALRHGSRPDWPDETLRSHSYTPVPVQNVRTPTILYNENG